MRPKKINISAFGPYAGRVDIDFDVLGDKGIYLISGNTGAGKTTIFEAVRFALYGDGGIDVRNSDTFRSKYASDDTPTFVELIFLLKGNVYTIKRSPKYKRLKTRGDGYTESKPEAELYMPDGRIMTGYSNVSKIIEELTGLTGEQFTRIVMIAQGKFRELLVADTVSRGKIFREIFKTDAYESLQRKVKSEYLDEYKAYTKTNDSIKQYVNGVKWADNSIYADSITEIQNQDIVSDIEGTLEVIRYIILEDTENINNLFKEQELVERELDDNNKALIEQRKLKDIYMKLQEKNEELSKDEESAINARNVYVAEEDKKDYRESLLIEINKLKEDVNKYKIRADKLIELSELEKSYGKLKESIDKMCHSIEEREKDIAKISQDIEMLTEIDVMLVKLEGNIKDTNQENDKINNIQKLRNEYEKAKEKYAISIKEYEKQEFIWKKKKEEYDIIYKAFLDGQAGIMANKLRDNPGMPCPVCGSVHYEDLAISYEDIPTEERVNELKLLADEAISDVNKASKKAGAYSEALQKAKELIVNALNEFNRGLSDLELQRWISEYQKEIATKLDILKVQKHENEKLIEKREYLKNQLIADTAKQEKEKQEYNESMSELQHLEANIAGKKLELHLLSEQLKEEDMESAINLLEEKQQMYKVMVDSYNDAKKTYGELELRLAQYKAVIKELNEQLGEKEVIPEQVDTYMTDLEKIIENINSKKSLLQMAYNEVYARLASNKEILKHIEELSKDMTVRAENLGRMKALSDTLNGEVSGKDKIKLETFVQIAYFEQIIDRANVRFFEMSEGQYEFLRDADTDNKKSQSGLELNVFDHYNGTVRSVKTLSGGEGFMASLSLALGMAEIIEESAGGIEIDTMFIDEGFGTLDDVALEQAMRVLSKMSEGNKLVGIISHVANLKERIDKQICVVKEPSGGSSVVMI